MLINKRKTVLFSCVFLIAGIGIGIFSPEDFPSFAFFYFLTFCFLSVLAFVFRKDDYKRTLLLAGVFLFLGIWRADISRFSSRSEDIISFYNGQKTIFEGYVSDEPDFRLSGQKLEITPNGREGKVLVSLDMYPRYDYGDILKISCELKAPEAFDGFAYDRYLARHGIYSVCYYPKLSKIGEKNGFSFFIFQKLFHLKKYWHEQINLYIPEPEAGLASAMVLGYKRGINTDLSDDLSAAGLSHIAAISGLHIGIISGLIFFIAVYIGLTRKKAFYLALVLIFLYIAMIGFPPSAVRAGVMGFLALLALLIGRLNRLLNALMLVASIFLFVNPNLLRDDIGFQLSFLAVLGIALVYPALREKIKNRGAWAEIVAVSLSAQTFTWLIVAWNFGVISLIAPISNILVLWILPALLILILSGCFLSYFLPFLAEIFFFLAYLACWYIVKVADFLSFGVIHL